MKKGNIRGGVQSIRMKKGQNKIRKRMEKNNEYL